VTTSSGELVLLGDAGNGRTIDINNLIISNNEIQSPSFTNMVLIANGSIDFENSRFTNIIILNNYNQDEVSDVLISNINQENDVISGYIFNDRASEDYDPLVLGTKTASEISSSEKLKTGKYINKSNLDTVEAAFDDVFGINGYIFDLDANSNLKDVKLSVLPYVDVLTSTTYSNKSGNIRQIDFDFKFIYSSFPSIPLSESIIFSDTMLKVGSDSFSATKNNIKANPDRSYSVSFKGKFTTETLKSAKIQLESNVTSGKIVDHEHIVTLIDKDFSGEKNVDRYKSISTTEIILIVLLVIIIILMLI